MKEIVKKVENDTLLLEMDSKIYSIKAITQASYKLTDKCYIHIDTKGDDITEIYFKPKEKGLSLEEIAHSYCNDVIDQQFRIDVNKDFQNIREEIVKKAFSPIS